MNTSAPLTPAALGLHPSKPGTVCRCGPCAHRITGISRRLGLSPEQLRDRLQTAPAPQVERAQKPRPRTLGSVASRATITRDGQRLEGEQAVIAMVVALGQDGRPSRRSRRAA